MPIGIYLIKSAENISVGQIVVFKFPSQVVNILKNRRWVPTKVNMLMKQVVAVKGDRISIDNGCLHINGAYFGPVHKRDNQGLELPVFRISDKVSLKSDEYFVATNAENSFDSRYFGPIHSCDIQNIVEPLFIFSK